MAATFFTPLGGRMVMTTPVATLIGAACERLPGVSRSPVEIIANGDAYWIKVQLPIRREVDLVYVTYGFEHETRMRVVGAIGGGETMETATTPIELGRRAQGQQVHPLGQFTISFDLPGPVSLAIRYDKLCDDATYEIFLLKAHAFEGEGPPASPPEQATQPAAPPPPEEEAPPAPTQTSEEATSPPPRPTSSA